MRNAQQQQHYLLALIKAISQLTNKPIDQYLNDYQQLIDEIKNVSSFYDLTALAQVDYKKTYKWYNDTFVRQNSRKMTQTDKKILEREIRQQIKNNGCFSREFQFQLKRKLSQPYYRSEFSIHYNNVLRRLREQKESLNSDSVSLCFNAFDVL